MSGDSSTCVPRVLVVDDSRDAADSLALLVKLWGHEPVVAYDGWAALEAACARRPDVVLLDLGLPGLDGLEVARRLRKSGFEDVLLVAVTGYSRDEDRRRAWDAGFDEFLVKPPELDLLQALLAGVRVARRPLFPYPSGYASHRRRKSLAGVALPVGLALRVVPGR